MIELDEQKYISRCNVDILHIIKGIVLNTTLMHVCYGIKIKRTNDKKRLKFIYNDV